jgi:hypothetical protein
MSSDIVVSGAALPLTEPAQAAFNQDLVNMLFANAPRGTPVPLFHKFLELSARYQLDANANQIWLAAMPGKNGGPGHIVVLIGRDGYMAVANRRPDFISCAGQAVYENDELDVEIDETGGLASFRFRPAHPARRGEPQGAFAILRREDKPALYFFAPLAQFRKNGGAWKYEDPMIIKCAQSYLLRTTYGVSGAVPFDEVSVGFVPPSDTIDASASDAPTVEMPPELSMLVARAYAVDSKSWRPNEVLARLPEPDDKNFGAMVKQIAAELEAWLAENEPTDAVVVDPQPDVPDPAAECQHRWDTDQAWRALVQPVLGRYYDAEAALENAIAEEDDAEAARLRNQIEAIAAELFALGVPEGWVPESAGSQS